MALETLSSSLQNSSTGLSYIQQTYRGTIHMDLSLLRNYQSPSCSRNLSSSYYIFSLRSKYSCEYYFQTPALCDDLLRQETKFHDLMKQNCVRFQVLTAVKMTSCSSGTRVDVWTHMQIATFWRNMLPSSITSLPFDEHALGIFPDHLPFCMHFQGSVCKVAGTGATFCHHQMGTVIPHHLQ